MALARIMCVTHTKDTKPKVCIVEVLVSKDIERALSRIWLLFVVSQNAPGKAPQSKATPAVISANMIVRLGKSIQTELHAAGKTVR